MHLYIIASLYLSLKMLTAAGSLSLGKAGKTFIPNDTVLGTAENPAKFVLVSGEFLID